MDERKVSRMDDKGFTPDFKKDAEREFVAGRNSAIEALRSDRSINKVYIQKNSRDGSMRMIERMARDRGAPVQYVEKEWLDRLTKSPHQGVAVFTAARDYSTVDEILRHAAGRPEKPLLVVACGIMDPQNLGAIIRSAETSGAHGVIIPKRNAAGLTETVAKASAGAIEHMRVARVSNIADTLRSLKKRDIWVIGADSEGTRPYTECDMTAGVALAIGGEGAGLGRLIKDMCDFVVKIPTFGEIKTLNASAAAAVILYEAVRQRAAGVGKA